MSACKNETGVCTPGEFKSGVGNWCSGTNIACMMEATDEVSVMDPLEGGTSSSSSGCFAGKRCNSSCQWENLSCSESKSSTGGGGGGGSLACGGEGGYSSYNVYNFDADSVYTSCRVNVDECTGKSTVVSCW